MGSRVTPMDIESQVFRRKMRGWDTQEVQLYLHSVAEEVERLNLENGELREEAGRLRTELDGFRKRETMLQETLVAAQQMGTELKEKARRDGELVVKEARLRADDILRQARDELTRLDGEIGRSRAERESLEGQLRSVIDQHLTMLELRKQARGKAETLRAVPRQITSEVG